MNEKEERWRMAPCVPLSADAPTLLTQQRSVKNNVQDDKTQCVVTGKEQPRKYSCVRYF